MGKINGLQLYLKITILFVSLFVFFLITPDVIMSEIGTLLFIIAILIMFWLVMSINKHKE